VNTVDGPGYPLGASPGRAQPAWGVEADRDRRAVVVPLFRWARRRGLITRSPMAEFELPTSTYVAREHVLPEVDQPVGWAAANGGLSLP
jgi:hypothetical protein